MCRTDLVILRLSFDLAVRFRADQVIFKQKVRDIPPPITSTRRAYGIYLELNASFRWYLHNLRKKKKKKMRRKYMKEKHVRFLLLFHKNFLQNRFIPAIIVEV